MNLYNTYFVKSYFYKIYCKERNYLEISYLFFFVF